LIRFGENSAQRLPEFATELAQLNVSVIVTLGELATRAARRGAPDTPIVFLSADPVGNDDVSALDIAKLAQALLKPCQLGRIARRSAGKHPADARRILRLRDQWPSND
jgi:hypothetical protein